MKPNLSLHEGASSRPAVRNPLAFAGLVCLWALFTPVIFVGVTVIFNESNKMSSVLGYFLIGIPALILSLFHFAYARASSSKVVRSRG